ncbi:MAG: gamma-glutamylcyclotransferase [Gemmatimonadota bacterium]|nr:gamma-glutamylcyclotransferase [Gemmatimonadota bacterium]
MARRADTHRKGVRSGCSIALFVYGTLKRGYSNHDGYCHGVQSIEEALVRGQLYIRPDRIPFLEVPEQDVLATGTADPAADAAAQQRAARGFEIRQQAESPAVPPVSGRGVVRGESLVFDDPETRLPAIDRLEGFQPGGRSLYRRVLVPVRVKDSFTVAWTYVVETRPRDWPRLKSDCWTG